MRLPNLPVLVLEVLYRERCRQSSFEQIADKKSLKLVFDYTDLSDFSQLWNFYQFSFQTLLICDPLLTTVSHVLEVLLKKKRHTLKICFA